MRLSKAFGHCTILADTVRRFQKDKEQFVAVLEGKGARDPLGRPFAGRRMSAVDQAYPPAFITRYLVEQALGGVWRQRFEGRRQQQETEATGTART
jgi:hypothetical protein